MEYIAIATNRSISKQLLHLWSYKLSLYHENKDADNAGPNAGEAALPSLGM